MQRPFHAISILIGALAALLFLATQSTPPHHPPPQVVLAPRPFHYVSKWKTQRREQIAMNSVTPAATVEAQPLPSVSTEVAAANSPEEEIPTYETGCGRDQQTGEVYPAVAEEVELPSSAWLLDTLAPATAIATCGTLPSVKQPQLASESTTAGLWWYYQVEDFGQTCIASGRMVREIVVFFAEQSSDWSQASIGELESLPTVTVGQFVRE